MPATTASRCSSGRVSDEVQSFADREFVSYPTQVNFRPLRLSVALLGDRLAVAALNGSRVEAFTVDAESPAQALRAELDARRLPARAAALALARSAVSVKQIELPPVAGDTREMVGFELERHL